MKNLYPYKYAIIMNITNKHIIKLTFTLEINGIIKLDDSIKNNINGNTLDMLINF